MKKFLLLILLLPGIKYTYAQSAHLKFDHFTVTDGLPEQLIRFIKQDDKCFIWTGAQSDEDTGLGLSLTYDIAVKGYGGKIEVDTKGGVYRVCGNTAFKLKNG